MAESSRDCKEERARRTEFYEKFKYRRVSPSPISDEMKIRRSREASMRDTESCSNNGKIRHDSYPTDDQAITQLTEASPAKNIVEEYRLKIMAKLGQKMHSSGTGSNYNHTMENSQRNDLPFSKNQSQHSPMTATQFYAGSNNSPNK